MLRDGKPEKHLLMCFFESPSPDGMRWLGVLTESHRGSVSFFPGFHDQQTWMRVHGGKSTRQLNLEIDHFTLEAGRARWHATSGLRDARIRSMHTYDFGERRRFWFGLSIADPKVLRAVMRETRVEADVPVSDASRRGRSVLEAREGVEFNVVCLPDATTSRECFIHFEFVVGPSGFEHYTGPRRGAGVNSLPEQFPIRLHRLRLSANTDIEVTTMREAGSLDGGIWLTAYNAQGVQVAHRGKA